MMTLSSKDKLIAGIDGDVLVYRSAFAGQHALHSLVLDDGTIIKQSQKKRELLELAALSPATVSVRTESVVKDEATVKRSLTNTYKTIMKFTNADKGIIYLSGKSNFRNEVATTVPYKGNRVSTKPVFYDYVKEEILKSYETVTSDFCEADDLLAIELTKEYEKAKQLKTKNKCNFICCTIDKDLLTVPGWHYNITSKTLKWVNNKDASKFFYTQMLVGDTADNIKGIYGIGYKSAEILFEDCKTPSAFEDITIQIYRKTYGDSEWRKHFLEAGRLLHMQRYDGQLWSPLNKNIITKQK
jgi:DNA polymerase-1